MKLEHKKQKLFSSVVQFHHHHLLFLVALGFVLHGGAAGTVLGALLPPSATVAEAGRAAHLRRGGASHGLHLSLAVEVARLHDELPDGGDVVGNLDVAVVELDLVEDALAQRDGAFRLHGWHPLSREAEIRDKAERALADVAMADRRNMLSGSLSRGDKRRLEMAMCLVQEPRLLLLDEPTAGMARADTNATIDLLKRIGSERNITKVVIEHDMHVVFSLADRISVLAQGHVIVEDAPENIKGNAKVQEAYLGGAHL